MMDAIPICVITGHIAGDSDACGDCDPCSNAYAVPSAVRRLLAEKDEWREKYGKAMSELDITRSALGGCLSSETVDEYVARISRMMEEMTEAQELRGRAPDSDDRTNAGTDETGA